MLGTLLFVPGGLYFSTRMRPYVYPVLAYLAVFSIRKLPLSLDLQLPLSWAVYLFIDLASLSSAAVRAVSHFRFIVIPVRSFALEGSFRYRLSHMKCAMSACYHVQV